MRRTFSAESIQWMACALAVAVLAVLMIVLLWTTRACGASSLVVPGNATVSGNVLAGSNVSALNVTASSLISMPDFSCPAIRQPMLIQWSRGQVAPDKVLTPPDTVGYVPPQLYFYAPVAGEIGDVFFGIEDAGSGWDSLTVNVLAGATGDSTVLYTKPMLTPADGDAAVTLVDGRSAETLGGIRVVEVGERVQLTAEMFGAKGDPPTGLVVWLVFYPNY
jgi:hypothetical protein